MAHEKQEHRSAFDRWYANERHFTKTADELGISNKTIHDWAKKFSWRERADAMDLELQRKSERDAVKRQQKLIEKQRQAGESLRLRGQEYLATNKIARASDAIKAIQVGVELERQAEGLPDWVLQLQTMSEDELQAELARQLRLARLEGEGDSDGVGGTAEEEGDTAAE